MGCIFGKQAFYLPGASLSFTPVSVLLRFDSTPSSFSWVWDPVLDGIPGWIRFRRVMGACLRQIRPCPHWLLGWALSATMNWSAALSGEPVGSLGVLLFSDNQRPRCFSAFSSTDMVSPGSLSSPGWNLEVCELHALLVLCKSCP